MITNTQHEPESTAVSFTLLTNSDKGSQPPPGVNKPSRSFEPYKFVTQPLTTTAVQIFTADRTQEDEASKGAELSDAHR